MTHFLSGPRRISRIRLLAVIALVVLTGTIATATQRASAAPAGQQTDLRTRPCPRLWSRRPCPPPPPTTVPAPAVPGLLEAKDFTAFVNRQPLATPKLIVTGTLVFGSPGYTPTLQVTQPQGINPDILLLDLVVTQSPLFQPQVVTEVPVRFESTDFTTVSEVNIITIGLQIPVTIVQ